MGQEVVHSQRSVHLVEQDMVCLQNRVNILKERVIGFIYLKVDIKILDLFHWDWGGVGSRQDFADIISD